MSSEIIDYMVVESTPGLIANVVKEWIGRGWQPLGGVAVAANKPGLNVINCAAFQAMVRFHREAVILSPSESEASSERSVPCPLCQVPIAVADLQAGDNVCPHCEGTFTVEGSG